MEAFVISADEDAHTTWQASFDENRDEDGIRIVIATLHTGSDDAAVTITIAGSFYWGNSSGEPQTRAKLAKAIAESYALETLYDIARVQANALASLAQATIDLPLTSPKALVQEFSERPEEVAVAENAS
jgi:hypothetical protein